MAAIRDLIEKWAALYVRLSRDDDNEGDSNSIAHHQESTLRWMLSLSLQVPKFEFQKSSGFQAK